MTDIRYGKIIDGKLWYATNPVRTDGEMIANPTDEMYEEFGYKHVTYTDSPEREGYYYTPFYTEREDDILQEWEEHEIVEEAIATDYESALERLGVQ